MLRHRLLSALLNNPPAKTSERKPKFVDNIMNGKQYDIGFNSTILVLDRAEAEQCEVTVVSLPPAP